MYLSKYLQEVKEVVSKFSNPAAAAAESLQSCPNLCDPIDCSPPGSPVLGILQARTLEWVAVSFSTAWKGKVKVKSLSRVQLSDPMDCSLPGSSVHGIFQARVLEWVAIEDKQKRKENRNSLTSILSTNNSGYFMCFSCFSFYWMSVFIIITEDIKQTKQSANSKRWNTKTQASFINPTGLIPWQLDGLQWAFIFYCWYLGLCLELPCPHPHIPVLTTAFFNQFLSLFPACGCTVSLPFYWLAILKSLHGNRIWAWFMLTITLCLNSKLQGVGMSVRSSCRAFISLEFCLISISTLIVPFLSVIFPFKTRCFPLFQTSEVHCMK